MAFHKFPPSGLHIKMKRSSMKIPSNFSSTPGRQTKMPQRSWKKWSPQEYCQSTSQLAKMLPVMNSITHQWQPDNWDSPKCHHFLSLLAKFNSGELSTTPSLMISWRIWSPMLTWWFWPIGKLYLLPPLLSLNGGQNGRSISSAKLPISTASPWMVTIKQPIMRYEIKSIPYAALQHSSFVSSNNYLNRVMVLILQPSAEVVSRSTMLCQPISQISAMVLHP